MEGFTKYGFIQIFPNELICSEISSKESTLLKQQAQLLAVSEEIHRSFAWLNRNLLTAYCTQTVNECISKTEVLHNKKLSNLGIRNKLAPCDPIKVVHNFSSLQLSAKLRTILAYGLDFNLSFYKLDFYRYFLPFEKLALRLSRDDHVPNTSELLPRLQTLVKKYFNGFKPYKIFSPIIQCEAIDELTKLSQN